MTLKEDLPYLCFSNVDATPPSDVPSVKALKPLDLARSQSELVLKNRIGSWSCGHAVLKKSCGSVAGQSQLELR